MIFQDKQPEAFHLQSFIMHCKVEIHHTDYLNSLAPGRFEFNFRKVIFKLT